MAERRDSRQWLIAVVLVVACIALIATSPPNSVSEMAEGDVEVGPGSPAEIHVRFAIEAGEQPSESIQVFFDFFDGQHDPRITASSSASIGDSVGQTTPAALSLELDPEECIDDCTVDAIASLEWVGPQEASLRLHWEAVLTIRFGASHATATANVIDGAGPTVPRGAWVGLGALGAVLAGTFLAGRSSMWKSLVAAGAIPLLVWRAFANVNLYASTSGFSAHWSRPHDLLISVVALALAGAFAVGVWRAWRGRPSVLRVVGWITVPIAAVSALLIVLDLPTYRPHEITLAAFVGGVPIAAAATAGTAVPSHAAPTFSKGTALVVACQALMFSFAVGLLVWLILALIPATNILRSSGWETALIAFVVTAAVLVLFAEGVRRWIMGEPRVLFVANLPFLVLSFAAAGISLIVGGEGLLAPVEIETKAVLITAAIVAFTGAIGLAMVAPPVVAAKPAEPAPNDDRDGERG